MHRPSESQQPPLVTVPAVKCQQGRALQAPEILAQEALLEIRVGDHLLTRQLYLPGGEVDLALGFLLTSGVIDHPGHVRDWEFTPAPDHAGGVLTVSLTRELDVFPDYGAWLPDALLRNDAAARRPLAAVPPPNAGDPISITPARLLELMAQLPLRQTVFRLTGGTHAILAADPVSGQVLLEAEDVGRHNAFDKVIGQALRRRLPLHDKVAILSGRASYEMVLKAARAAIPLLAAVSAPTSLAVQLADCQGLTLVGFARQDRLTLYTHPQRLAL